MAGQAGYSGTPLARKLGIKPGMRIAFIAAPPDLPELLRPLPEAEVLQRPGTEMDLIHAFVTTQEALNQAFPTWRGGISKTGSVWVSWPKQTSGVQTDLNGNIVREIGLSAGLVDVKVCAVSEVWSGLKFVWRTQDR